MDSSFTDGEKVRGNRPAPPPVELPTNHRAQRFVLAEMIKVSQIDIGALVDFARHYDIQPDWLSMQLPNGKFSAPEMLLATTCENERDAP